MSMALILVRWQRNQTMQAKCVAAEYDDLLDHFSVANGISQRRSLDLISICCYAVDMTLFWQKKRENNSCSSCPTKDETNWSMKCSSEYCGYTDCAKLSKYYVVMFYATLKGHNDIQTCFFTVLDQNFFLQKN